MTTEPAAQAEEALPATATTTKASWFMGAQEPVTLPVGGQTLTVRREINALAAHQIYRGLPDAETAGLMSRWEEFSLRKAEAYLLGWTLPKALPDASAAAQPTRLELLRAMRRGQFNRLYETIVTHESEQSRRFFEGALFSKAEWTAHVAANAALPAEQRATLPEFDTLSTIIAPVVSIAADSWFLPEDDSITLQLPDGHWMRIRSELTQGQHVALVTAEQKPDKETDPSPFATWPGARRIAAYLLDWSMVYPDGVTKVPVVRESLSEMDASKFGVVLATLTAYEELLTKEREGNPTGAQ